MDNITFHHHMPMQLRYNDADMQGHVNNSVYFQYYDTAKISYMHDVCGGINSHVGIVAAHIEADFLAQVHIGDDVEVETAVTHIGHKSFTLTQQLVDKASGQVKCVGLTVMVAFDLDKQQSIEMPEEWVEAMNAYEGRDLRK